MATSYRERMLNSTKKEPTTNDAVSVNTSYRQRLLNSKNKNNQPTQTVTEKMDSLWVESTAPNVLEKKNINSNIINGKDKYNSVLRAPVKQDFGDKIGNFFMNTIPNAAEDLWDDIKEPFVGKSEKQLLTEAKLSPKMLVEDAKIQLAKENPTREDYALVKQTQDIIKKYGKPESNIRAISEDTTKLQEQLKVAEKTWQASPVDAAVANTGAAAVSIFGNMASFANSLGADKIPLLKEVTNFAVDGARKAQQNAQQYNKGDYGEALGTVTQGIVNLVPYFLIGTGSAAVKGATTVSKYGKYIEPIIKNPSFWYSLTSMWGQKYQEKLDEGYNRFQALGNAILYALPASLIEVSGGIGAKGKEAQSLLRTMGEEIAEEIAQDIMSGVSDKIATNHDLPVFSTTEDAIINPKELAKTAVYTAPIVAIGGGANNVINKNINNRAENQKVQAQINQDLQNLRNQNPQSVNSTIQRENVTGLPKLEAQNQAQTQNIKQPNITLPKQAETAQNANMGQMIKNVENDTAKFSKQVDDLRKNNFNRQSELVVLENTPQILLDLGLDNYPITIKPSKLETIYNDTAKRKKDHPHDLGELVKEIPDALKRPLNVVESVTRPGSIVVVTDLADKNGDIVVVSINPNDKGQLEIDDITTNKDVNKLTSAYGKREYDYIVNKETGKYEDGWMELNRINDKILYDIDEGIIKKRINGQWLQSPNVVKTLSNNSINQNDSSVNTEYAQNNQNDTAGEQSAFSIPENYVSPVSDIQSATKFVENATVNDIETLQKMVEEVEKNPDRIDLQFFAEEAKKKIGYLTKSQRYQKNKADTLINKLWKTYGLDKTQVKKSIGEYIEAYNSDGDILEAREALLNELNANGILGEYASIEISNDIDNLNRELDTVRRYETDKSKTEEKREQNKNYYKVNKETIAKLYQLKKEYQTNADKAMQKILLTKGDSVQLDRLLKGEITFSELPKSVNVEQIRKAYDVRKPLVDVNKEIQNYNKAVKQQRNDKMRELTKNSAQWKDKKIGLAYARETQERNIADIAPAEDAKRIKKEIFEPIHHNEAEATRYKNEMRNKIKELNIDIKPKYEVIYADSEGGKTETVSESGLVQLYGEGKINDETLSRLGVDSEKIKRAVATFREIYNDLYNKTNDVLVQNGYAPVEFRKDYFPHFEETKPDTIIGKALNKLGFKMDTKELPTDIAGLTHTFRPGKKWVSNFLQRTTDVATYDAVKGFDSYLDSVADVIYHTDDIQNLRAYENALRYQHSEPVIKEQIDEVINMDIANEMKQSMIDQLYANAENSLAHYVTDLRAYTDNLAGKKSLEDRTMEHNLGRGIYNITKNVQSRVSANMVGANISSALTNFIPITQATSVIDGKNLIQATYDTVKNALKSDGFAEQSDFLTNRRGSDKLYKTTTDKLAGATNLMQVFDNITSEIINRGRYYQNVANGMSEADARVEADQMSGNIMADRSKGSMPTIFNQSSPVTKLLTAFQLEVNNQYSYLFKDIPNEYKDKAIGSLVWAFAKFFIGAWLYNELYEKMTGRRAALDPINIVTETIGDIKEGKKASEVVSELATEIVEDIPFVGGLIGGGRLPISNALPDVGETVKAGISLFEEGDKKKAWQTLGSELSKPVFYILPPFGGGQLKKSIEGISTFAKGGNYGINSQGQETLKYPVEQTPGNFVKSALFGKWSTKGAVDYVDNGFKSLSVNQTEGYEKAKKAGITDKQFYDAYNAQKKVDKLGDLTSVVKKNEIDKATRGLPQTKRKILYETFGVAKGEWNNTKVVYPYEIKAQKEKMAREKLKTKKK